MSSNDKIDNKYDNDIFETSWIWPVWLSWKPTSRCLLKETEQKLHNRELNCSFIKYTQELRYSIRTIVAKNFNKYRKTSRIGSSKDQTDRIPIVLLHGFGGGSGLWIKNIDALAENRTVYAMDLLGFARSSRIKFPSNSENTELTYINSIEYWRKSLDLNKFILVGHSFGGYLAAAYAIKHPDRISHLFLVDPWGFAEQKNNLNNSFFGNYVLPYLPFPTPLAIMRASGWLGPHLLRYVRQDFIGVFQHEPLYIGQEVEIPPLDGEKDQDNYYSTIESTNNSSDVPKNFDSETFNTEIVYDYIYHCNARNPTGEAAFRNLTTDKWWAAMPMLPRLAFIPTEVPITFIYGGRSWLDTSTGLKAKGLRSNSYVDVRIIPSGGHSAYAQCSSEFNNIVNSICSQIDSESFTDNNK